MSDANEPPKGTSPTPTERKTVEGNFPNIKRWSVTGQSTTRYNCIEWSLCKENEWVWKQVDQFGDKDGTVEVSDFDEFYKRNGFTPCGTTSSECKPECKKRKVALFCKDGKPKHAAKETQDDWWESKLGRSIKIIHRLPQLEGGAYGNVCRCYCKDDPKANLGLCPKEKPKEPKKR